MEMFDEDFPHEKSLMVVSGATIPYKLVLQITTKLDFKLFHAYQTMTPL